MNLTTPEIVMAIGLLVALAGVGYLVWQSKQSAAAPSVGQALRTDFANMQGWFAGELAKLHRASAPAGASTTEAPAAVAWSLGDSYSSLGALAADIKRPDFTREVGIDGAPVFNIGGGDPVEFYSVGGALTQTKPAT
jgi:hypothetical protein